MRIAGEEVGRRGVAVLGAAALVALLLAVHGYGRGFLAAGRGPLGVGSPAPARTTPPSGPSTGARTPSTTAPSGSGAGGATASSAPSTGQRLGPLLSSTSYASFAYEVYPGPMSPLARQALAGFDVSVHASGSTEVVRVAPVGYPQGAQASSYPRGDRVYFIEASFGDDSGNADYNGGDDGLVITTPEGRIVE